MIFERHFHHGLSVGGVDTVDLIVDIICGELQIGYHELPRIFVEIGFLSLFQQGVVGGLRFSLGHAFAVVLELFELAASGPFSEMLGDIRGGELLERRHTLRRGGAVGLPVCLGALVGSNHGRHRVESHALSSKGRDRSVDIVKLLLFAESRVGVGESPEEFHVGGCVGQYMAQSRGCLSEECLRLAAMA